MTISISTPTSNTGSIQNNSTDVLTIGSDNSVSVVNNLSSTSLSVNTDTLYVLENKVGIGTSSPAELLELASNNDTSGGVARNKLLFHDTDTAVATGQSAGTIEWTQDGGTVGAGTIGRLECIAEGTGGSYAMRFNTGNITNFAEQMRISSTGNVMIGTTAKFDTSTVGLSVQMASTAGTVIETKRNLTTGARQITFFNPNGQVGNIQTVGSATNYNTSSDYRLKENNVNITDGITRVKLLTPYRFNFIADADTTVDGFFAHEVQSVVPEAISGTHNEVDDEGNPVYQGIDQAKLVPLLTSALQEAITKIEDLETRIQTLENN